MLKPAPSIAAIASMQSLRSACVAALIGGVVACGQSQRNPPHASHQRSAGSEQVVFALTRLDGQRLPTAYSDRRGRFTLRAGQLTLDAEGNLWFDTDLVPDPDTVAGRARRMTYVGRYARAGPDSLVFPTEGDAMPEFFGRLDGAGGLRLVAHPLPRASGRPSAISVAAEHGGAHVWEFHVP
jgi:hypothetical protein